MVRLSQPGNLDGCAPLNAADTAAVAGNIAFVEWTDDNDRPPLRIGRALGQPRRCRRDRVHLRQRLGEFAAGITGSTVIPGVGSRKSGADAIRAQLLAGTHRAGQRHHAPTTSSRSTRRYNDTMINTGSSRGIGDAGNVKPDVAAVGYQRVLHRHGHGRRGPERQRAPRWPSPMVAGEAALVRSMHPDWNPEQVKADIMNTADADVYLGLHHTGAKYAPQRVGSGRIDVKAGAGQPRPRLRRGTGCGSVSSSFGPIAVVRQRRARRRAPSTIKVQNTGDTAATTTCRTRRAPGSRARPTR